MGLKWSKRVEENNSKWEQKLLEEMKFTKEDIERAWTLVRNAVEEFIQKDSSMRSRFVKIYLKPELQLKNEGGQSDPIHLVDTALCRLLKQPPGLKELNKLALQHHLCITAVEIRSSPRSWRMCVSCTK